MTDTDFEVLEANYPAGGDPTALQHHNKLHSSIMSTHMAMANYNKPELCASSIFAISSAELK